MIAGTELQEVTDADERNLNYYGWRVVLAACLGVMAGFGSRLTDRTRRVLVADSTLFGCVGIVDVLLPAKDEVIKRELAWTADRQC